MNIIISLQVFTGVILLSLQPLMAGNFAGSDNFTSLSDWNINPIVNGSPINTTNGNLKEESGQLSYTDGSSSTKDQDVWMWTPGTASSTDSWIMSMGVSNSVLTTSGTTAEIGFGVAKTGSLLADNLDLTMASFQGTQGFRLNLTTNGTTPTHDFNAASTTNASILLWFDKASDDLHVWYNQSPTDPNFTALADVNLDTLWNIQPSDSLTFFVIGASTDQRVATTSSAFGYNFGLQNVSPTPEPPISYLIIIGVFGLLVFQAKRRWENRLPYKS